MRARHLKYTYGITSDQWDALWEQQLGRCPVCDKPLPEDTNALALDHCYETGIVRGILHTQCNAVLGQAGDDPAVLRGAAEYLERTALTGTEAGVLRIPTNRMGLRPGTWQRRVPPLHATNGIIPA